MDGLGSTNGTGADDQTSSAREGVPMRQTTACQSWVVYETPAAGKMPAMRVVCEEGDWSKLKRDNPALKLVRGGITNEGEAERAARAATVSLLTGPRQYR
jgi:hypothetical protein